jgi:nanoRNase/pAp phosphatase (c-di-AMP/oligoRNAs hydrolase)
MTKMSDSEEPPQPFDLDQALRRLKGRSRMLIYTHDNPDPDALAAGLGLGFLIEKEVGATVTLAHGGIVGRAQNRAMVETLKIPLTPVERVDPDKFDIIALVDSQPETGNNSLPPHHRVDIVVDHHPPRAESARAPWCDIRPDRGTTSTLVFDYLRERHIPIDSRMATAIFFALRTETRDLGRESTDAERRAYIDLVPVVDHNLLYRMTHPKVPRAHFAALDRALRSAQVHGDLVAVNLGTLGYPDLVAEIADLLLSYEGAHFVLCMGQYEGNAYLSLRTEASEARAGSVMRQVVGTDGAAGGHGTMAGARLFATVHSQPELEASFQEMVRRLCEALGHPPTRPTPLLDTGGSGSS